MHEAVKELWRQVLKVDHLSGQSHFFDLGGNSLLAARLIGRMLTDLHLTVAVLDLFEAPRLDDFCARVFGVLEPSASARGDAEGMRQTLPASTVAATAGATAGAIAIVGMAIRCPGAHQLETFWRNVTQGQESIRFFAADELDPSLAADTVSAANYVPARGIMEDSESFDAAFFGLSPKEALATDPQHRVFLEVAWHALEDGGYAAEERREQSSIGVYGGVGSNDRRGTLEALIKLGQLNLTDAQLMVAADNDFLTSRVAHRLNLQGPAVTVQTACSTSLVAVHLAVQALRAGDCDLALAGGVSLTFPTASGHCYQEGDMQSRDGHTRSFAADASGTVFSDGAGVVLLKPLEAAKRDHDRIYAVITGSAINNDGSQKASFTAPKASTQAAVIKKALRQAGVSCRDIGLLEAHGTATPLGDPIEFAGLLSGFGDAEPIPIDQPWCAIGSVKSNIGHVVAAAGVCGLIKTALSLYHQLIPASLHSEEPNPALPWQTSPFYLSQKTSWWPRQALPRRASISSFGVGGTNAHLVLEEPPAQPEAESTATHVIAKGAPQLLLLSAHTPQALAALKRELALEAAKVPVEHFSTWLRDAAFSLATGRQARACRFSLAASTQEQLVTELHTIPSSTPAAPQPQPLSLSAVFMCTGQGSQVYGMGEDLYRKEPNFARALDDCAELVGAQGLSLLSLMGIGQGGPSAEHAARLQETANAQPALFAFEYALGQLLKTWGVLPEFLIGHSLGEFTAACLAGVMSLEDTVAVVVKRGRLMQMQQQGAMLAVAMDPVALEQLLHLINAKTKSTTNPETDPITMVISAYNAPQRLVVSGSIPAIANLEQHLQALGTQVKRLAVSHAFHSPLMDSAASELSLWISEHISLHPPQIPIISTVYGRLLSHSECLDPCYWGKQLRSPVLFSAALQSAQSLGPRLFLEIGPQAALTSLAARQLSGASQCIATTRHTPEGELSSLLSCVGQVWQQLGTLSLPKLFETQGGSRISVPLYPFQREHLSFGRLTKDVPTQTDLRPSFGASPESSLKSSRHQDLQSQVASNIATNDSSLSERIASVVARVSGTPVTRLNINAHFLSLGFDSLLLTELSLGLSKAFTKSISLPQLLGELGSIAKLTQWIQEKAGLSEQPQGASLAVHITMDARYPPSPGAVIARDAAGFPYWLGDSSGV